MLHPRLSNQNPVPLVAFGAGAGAGAAGAGAGPAGAAGGAGAAGAAGPPCGFGRRPVAGGGMPGIGRAEGSMFARALAIT